MVAVEPQSYYDAATTCYQLSKDFQAAFNPLQSTLLATGGMAGGYQAAKAWAKSYDDRAVAFTSAATEFARATQRLGDIFIACGYNWDWHNYSANRNPNRGPAPTRPSKVPTDLPYGPFSVTGVASSKKNGNGLDTNYPELLEKATAKIAGGEIPDGDTDKLSKAATAWRTFGDHQTIAGAPAKLNALRDSLAQFDSPDIKNLSGHIETLAKNVTDIQLVSNDMSNSVFAHHGALVEFRDEVNTQVTAIIVGAAISIAVIAVVIVAGAGSLAVSGATLETAAGTIASLGGTFLAALGGITFSSEALTIVALSAITALTVASVAGDAPGANNPAEDPNYDRLRPAEQDTLRRAQEAWPDLGLRGVPDERDGEYVDKNGNTYDQMGNPKTSDHWSPRAQQQFEDSIDAHLRKSNDGTIIDLTGFSEESREAIREYVDSLPPTEQVKILRIGF